MSTSLTPLKTCFHKAYFSRGWGRCEAGGRGGEGGVVATHSSVAPEGTEEEAAPSSCKPLAADGGRDVPPARVPKDHAAMARWVGPR